MVSTDTTPPPSPAPPPRVRAGGVRATITTLLLLLGCVVFAWKVNHFYPLKHWLIWRYLQYWLACAVVACASMSSGMRLVAALGGRALILGEYLLLSFASGVLLFGFGVFAGGMLKLYGPFFFFAWPLILLAAGGRAPWRTLARAALRLIGTTRTRELAFWPRSLFELARALLLAVGLLGIYLQVITPENISYDARWYHLPIAEVYAAQGGIERFAEGWYLGAYPQLATWLYTWAFQCPGSLFDHVTLASHLEWLLFLGTVPGVGLLVRHLIAPARVRWTACVLFTFPSLYLYDTNLNGAADHILAFWALPFALAVIAAIAQPSWQRVVLASLPAAGAILTRYQAIYLVAPASLIVLFAFARAKQLKLLWPGIAALLVLTAPHWLDWIYYGDPLYPVLHNYLPSHPFHRDAPSAMLGSYVPTNFTTNGSLAEQLREILFALPTFSFRPHNWGNLELPQPTFGSLFTLLGVALPFLTRAKRIWLLLISCYLGVAIWYWTNHQDRFLQALLPWMAACVVALCVRIWQLGVAPRFALVMLVGLQLVWGADFYFSPNHTIVNDSLIIPLAKHLRGGIRGEYAERFRHWGELDKINRVLPRDAVLLMHKGGWRLGLERRVVSDEYGYQGALSYTVLGTPRAVWKAWHDLGITHVYWNRNEDRDADESERKREAVFRAAVKQLTRNRVKVPGSFVAELVPEPPL